VTPCPVCGVGLAYRESCPSPSCPCYGMRAGTAEADVAAERWRARPSVAARRTMTGADAVAALETRVWLEMAGACGAVLDIEIEHT
jgi:hypothetical protein